MNSSINAEISNIFNGHSDAIYALENYNNNTFFSGSADGFVGYWNVISGAFEKPLAKVNSSIYSLKLLADSILLIGELSGILNVIDIDSKEVIKTIKLSDKGLFAIEYFPENETILVGAGDGNLYILDSKYNLNHTIQLSTSNIRTIDVSPCGRFAVVGASDHQVYFLEYDQELIIKQVIPAHKNSVFTVIYKTGYELLSGGRDAMLNQWKWNPKAILDNQKWELQQSIPAHNYTINKIQVNSNKPLFATSSRDKTIKIWNSNNLDLLKVIDIKKYPNGHTHSVNTILWIDDETLLSAGDDKKIIAWKVVQLN